MEYWKWLSKKWQEQQKWAILKSFLENLANCPKQRSFFGPLKTFEPKLWPFWHFYIQRWKNLDLAPVPPFDSIFTFWFMDMLFSFKTLTAFQPLLVLDFQPNFPMVQLWCPLWQECQQSSHSYTLEFSAHRMLFFDL